jgi:hypothetical protein
MAADGASDDHNPAEHCPDVRTTRRNDQFWSSDAPYVCGRWRQRAELPSV